MYELFSMRPMTPPLLSHHVEFHIQVQMEVDVRFVQDTLKGDNITEIRLKFVKRLEDAIPVGED